MKAHDVTVLVDLEGTSPAVLEATSARELARLPAVDRMTVLLMLTDLASGELLSLLEREWDLENSRPSAYLRTANRLVRALAEVQEVATEINRHGAELKHAAAKEGN